jgi:hypothetical protein
MTDRKVLLVVAFVITVAFILVAVPTHAQVETQPRIERPRVNTGPQLQIDPQVLQRPNLRLRLSNVEFRAKFDERLLERASSMNLYRMQPSPINTETMQRLGERLGIEGEIVQTDDLIATASGQSGFMATVPGLGKLVFNVNLADQIDDRPGDLPSERQAGQIAMEFLRENELMPDAEQAVVAHIGRIRSASFDPRSGNEAGPIDQALVVHFARQVDDIRVVGPGSKAVVQIGDGGEIAGGGVGWRGLGDQMKLSPRQLHGVEAVNKSIQQQLGQEFGMANAIVVDRVGVFYHDAGGYLQPVVGYQAQVTSGEIRYSYFGQVPLMQQPPVQVGPQQISPEIREMLQKGPEDMQPETEGRND